MLELNDEQLTIFRRRNIGFIFQNYNLLPMLNVYENIVLPIELDGKSVDQEFLKEIISILGLEERINSMPNMLSGGQQQRVAIARVPVLRAVIRCFPTSKATKNMQKPQLLLTQCFRMQKIQWKKLIKIKEQL